MTTKSADYCILVNEWAWKVRRVLIKAGIEVDLGLVLESTWTEMGIWCI